MDDRTGMFAIERPASIVLKKSEDMKEGIDRRAARTRKALHGALMSLILRKGYEAVTIQDIIDEADVGRSTFYAHYTGKEDLLRRGFEMLRALLAEAGDDAPPERNSLQEMPLKFGLALFEHVCEYEHVYKALLGGRGGAVADDELRRVVAEQVRRDLPAASDGDAIPQEVRVQFVVATFLAVTSWSFAKKPRPSPARMNDMFQQLVANGLDLSTETTVDSSISRN